MCAQQAIARHWATTGAAAQKEGGTGPDIRAAACRPAFVAGGCAPPCAAAAAVCCAAGAAPATVVGCAAGGAAAAAGCCARVGAEIHGSSTSTGAGAADSSPAAAGTAVCGARTSASGSAAERLLSSPSRLGLFSSRSAVQQTASSCHATDPSGAPRWRRARGRPWRGSTARQQVLAKQAAGQVRRLSSAHYSGSSRKSAR